MPRVWSIIKKNQDGSSLVEVLLAATVFGVVAIGLVGALIYGQESTDQAGIRSRAVMLAEEGTEAIRNIRGAGYTNLIDGTYGLAQSGGIWTMSGSSDTSSIFSRSVTIAANGTNRKTVTSTVSWARPGGTSTASVSTELTNWASTLIKSWKTPTLSGSADLTGTNAALKVATQGDYAYIVRSDGTPDFVILNIANPDSPTVVGSLSLSGAPTNIFVSGNYAYVTTTDDAAELRIINIATPASPVITGTYNAPGTADGRGVYVYGSYAHIVRNANGGSYEYVKVNVSNPASPVAASWYSSNITMYEVYAYNDSNVYVATSSDTAEVIEINDLLGIGLITNIGSFNLTGTADATTITGYGTALGVGQGTTFWTLEGGSTNSVYGSVTLPGTVNDLTYDPTLNLTWAGTSYASGELQIIDVSTVTTPAVYSSVDLSGSAVLSGVSYSASKNRVVGASSATNQEAPIFAPN